MRDPGVRARRLFWLHRVRQKGRSSVRTHQELRSLAGHKADRRAVGERHGGVVGPRDGAPRYPIFRERMAAAPATLRATIRAAALTVRQRGRAVIEHSVVQEVPVAAMVNP